MVVLVAGLVVGLLLPSGAFSLVDAARNSTIEASGDQTAELGMLVHSCVDKDNIDPLVDVTNNFQESMSITVSLDDPSLGTLHVGGQSGDSVTFSLAVGANGTVSFETTTGGPWPKNLNFGVDGSGGVTFLTAERSSQIDNNCDSTTPTPTPTATPTPTPTPEPNEPPVADFTMSRKNPNQVSVDANASYDPDGTIASYEWDVGADGTIDDTGETATLNARSGELIKLIVTDNDGATNSTTKTAP